MHAMEQRVFPGGPTSFYHLLFLATHPDCQGQGLGRKLLGEIQSVVRNAEDAEGRKEKRVVYLEASTRGSQRLYRRMGFVDRDEAVIGEYEEGEDAKHEDVNGDGGQQQVKGSKMFGMTWSP